MTTTTDLLLLMLPGDPFQCECCNKVFLTDWTVYAGRERTSPEGWRVFSYPFQALSVGHSDRNPEPGSGETWCEDCWSEAYSHCGGCGVVTVTDNLQWSEVTEESYCSDCYNPNEHDERVRCYDCSGTLDRGDIAYTDGDGDHYCHSCHYGDDESEFDTPNPAEHVRTCGQCSKPNIHLDCLTEAFLCDCEARYALAAGKPVVLVHPLPDVVPNATPYRELVAA